MTRAGVDGAVDPGVAAGNGPTDLSTPPSAIAEGDRFTLGFEQLVVCLALLAVSLWVLSTSAQRRDFCSGLAFRLRHFWIGIRRRWNGLLGKATAEEGGDDEARSGGRGRVRVLNSSAARGGSGMRRTASYPSQHDCAAASDLGILGESSSTGVGQVSAPLHETPPLPQDSHLRHPHHTICTGMVFPSPSAASEPHQLPIPGTPVREYSDHDRFVLSWETVRRSTYRRLVLPPECMAVDPPKKKKRKRSSASHGLSAGEYADDDDDDDGDGGICSRLTKWFNGMLGILRDMWSINFVQFIGSAIRYRRDRIRGKLKEEDDDEDDDEDDNSIMSRASSKADIKDAAAASRSTGDAGGDRTVPTAGGADGEDAGKVQVEMGVVHAEEKKEGCPSEEDDASVATAPPVPTNHAHANGNHPRRKRSNTLDSISSFASAGSASSSAVWASPLPSHASKKGGGVGGGGGEAGRQCGDEEGGAATDREGRGGVAGQSLPPLPPAPKSEANVKLPPGSKPASQVNHGLPSPRQLSGGSVGGGTKKKDALELYRTGSGGGPQIPTLKGGGGAAATPIGKRAGETPPLTPQSSNLSSYLPALAADANPEAAPPPPPVLSSSPPPSPKTAAAGNAQSGTGRRGSWKEASMNFFDAAGSKDTLMKLSREVPVPDKNGYILGDEFLPDASHTPLLVFVNSRSGPQQGQVLIAQLRRLLNPIQVWDLADGGPERALESFSALSRLRILVCGGDGTVSWIISSLEKMGLEQWPPIAILPLGTGNDLARIHGWGGGYNNESLLLLLEQISEAYVSLLDRWEMKIEDKKGRAKGTKSFTNYLGVGADAQAALQVHMLRESKPKLFFSRAVNKAWYAVFGAEDTFKGACGDMPEEITLVADGVEVPIPSDSQGIILLNIDSYSGGVPFWSTGVRPRRWRERRFSEGDFLPLSRAKSFPSFNFSDMRNDMEKHNTERFSALDSCDERDEVSTTELTDEEKLAKVTACDKPSSCQDGMLDVVSIRSAFHLGQIRVGLSNAQRLCQCREATITIKKKVSVQIDGEPWRQNVGTLRVTRKQDPAVMLHRAAEEGGGVETEMAKLLDWAEERHIIDRSVHSTLMKEFSRRIESKTRQRRVRSQDNLMLSLKRAIVNNNPSF